MHYNLPLITKIVNGFKYYGLGLHKIDLENFFRILDGIAGEDKDKLHAHDLGLILREIEELVDENKETY